jgi:hypothetical protein
MAKFFAQYVIPALIMLIGVSLIAGEHYVAGGLVSVFAGHVFMRTRLILNV